MKNTAKHISNRKGFTLIEAIVVMAIMAVMGVAMISLINPARQIAKGRDATRKSDLAVASAGLEQIYAQANRYPDHTGEAIATCSSNNCTWECLKIGLLSGDLDCDKNTAPDLPSGTLKVLPEDPQLASGYDYCYVTDANGQNYALCSWLETAVQDEYNPALMNCTPRQPLLIGADTEPRKIYCVTNPF